LSDPERIDYLEKRVDEQSQNPNRQTHTLGFRGQAIHPPVIRVDIDFPRYRLSNGRTRRMQEAYLANHPTVPADLFKDGASEEAQAAQHDILVDMAKLEKLDELLQSEGQRQPLVITFDGYVVNGNRRLAIIRTLKMAAHVDVVVLPSDADQRDLAMLEMDLQMAKDGKADYNWVDELLTIQTNVEVLKIDKKQVATAMHVYEKSINLKLHQLALVNLYLDELGHPGEHYRVDGDEQAFETLTKADMDQKDPAKQANLRQLAFNIIRHPKKGLSVHRQIEALVKSLDRTIILLDGSLTTRGVTTRVKSEAGTETETGGLLDELDDPQTVPVVFDVKIDEKTAEAIHEAVDVASGLTDEAREAARPLALAKQAAAALQLVQIKGDTTDIEGLLGQLAAVEASCVHIRAEVLRIKAVE
jgi:hypothetical protein